jgi:hypothetical protein
MARKNCVRSLVRIETHRIFENFRRLRQASYSGVQLSFVLTLRGTEMAHAESILNGKPLQARRLQSTSVRSARYQCS